jgi:cytoskeletal protein CcmA (bactofilin family)
LGRFRREAQSDDSGVALAAVIGVMAVGLLLTALIATTVVSGLGQTTAARADVQSQASADAGAAAARVGLELGTCAAKSGLYVNSAAEATAGILYRAIITVPNALGAWVTPPVAGCPANASVPVRIVSTGTAAAGGTSGQTAGDTSFVEAIYSAPAAPPISGSGAAIYANSATSFSNAGRVYGVNGSSPTVMVKTGDVTCSGGASSTADLIVAAGTLTTSNGCRIGGNLFVSGRASISGDAQIGGSVVAAGVTMANSVGVAGSVWSTLDLTMSGTAKVTGNVTAASLSTSGGLIAGNAWVYGTSDISSSSITGNLTTKKKTGSGAPGSLTVVPSGPGASPYVTPTVPTVPLWVDFGYVKADWVGFTEYVLPTTATCTLAMYNTALTTIGTAPGIIDARGCTNGIALSGPDRLTLQNDLAIFANKFSFANSSGFDSAAAARLWLITPEAATPTTNATNHAPDCVAAAMTFSIGGNVSIDTDISTMIYTPCDVTISNAIDLRGQIYAGTVSLPNAVSIGYVPVGLPGVDLGQGTNGTPGGAVGPRILTSYRNVQSGG